jgi:uncharacterized protein YdeI (YjbR/CyaY-like superfamily)
VVAALGKSRKPPVTVSINGHTENRTAAGVGAGDEVEVELELDTAPREVILPPDFAAALAGDAKTASFFETLSFSQQSGFVIPIEQARAQETRERRIEKTIAKLHAGQKS